MPTLADTGGLLALADSDDAAHAAASAYIASTQDLLVVPVTVLPEADYLISRHLGSHVAQQVLRDIVGGALRVEPVTDVDLRRALELMERYADSDIGFVDASIVAVAERLRIPRILTLDRRHFGLIRPLHCPAFELVP